MDGQEKHFSKCEYHYQRQFQDVQDCGSWESTRGTYYRYDKTNRVSCGNTSCLNNSSYDGDSSITSKYIWFINNRYLHFMEHAGINSGCENRKIKSHHHSVLNTILSRKETQKVIIFVDQKPAQHLLSKAVRNVGLQVLNSIPSHGKGIY